MSDSNRFVIRFKAHRNSERIYTIETTEAGAGHFVKAALVANGWIVVEAGVKP